MFNKIALLAALSLAGTAIAQGSAAPPGELWESDVRTIGYATVAEALAAVRANPKARLMGEGDMTTYQVGKMGQPDYELWTFSSPAHPAHPSAIKRTFHLREGQIDIDMDVACDAAKPVCDQMVRDFQALNLKFQQAFGTPPKR